MDITTTTSGHEGLIRGVYGYSKAEAKRAEDDGLPALLPDGNRWKQAALDHRYGWHYDGCPKFCPQFGTDQARPITSEQEGSK